MRFLESYSKKKFNGFELPSAKKPLRTARETNSSVNALTSVIRHLCISHNTPCFLQHPLLPYPLPPFSFTEASLRRRKARDMVDCQQSPYCFKICERVR